MQHHKATQHTTTLSSTATSVFACNSTDQITVTAPHLSERSISWHQAFEPTELFTEYYRGLIQRHVVSRAGALSIRPTAEAVRISSSKRRGASHRSHVTGRLQWRTTSGVHSASTKSQIIGSFTSIDSDRESASGRGRMAKCEAAKGSRLMSVGIPSASCHVKGS